MIAKNIQKIWKDMHTIRFVVQWDSKDLTTLL